MPSEFSLIDRYFKRAAPAGMLGVGDDCALFAPPAGMQVATSTDLLIEGRHFFADADPRAVGHKSLAVNLSDLAAMGARPLACLLGLSLPRVDEAWLAAFAEGFHALAQASGCALIGGDTTSGPNIAISVTVFGAVAPADALRRSGARPGDDIWVSGELGAADIAYRLLAGEMPPDAALLAQVRGALEWPQPRLALGAALAGVASAAIDISDGLCQDLRHILQASGVGAELDVARLPVAAALKQVNPDRVNPDRVDADRVDADRVDADRVDADRVDADRVNAHRIDPARVRHALLGGGDVYELCFTASPARADAVLAAAHASATPVTRVGRIVAGAALHVRAADGALLADLPRGFDHFQES